MVIHRDFFRASLDRMEAMRNNDVIRSYGPGKFFDIVDSYVYSISLDGGTDEEAGSVDRCGLYGILRGCLSLSHADPRDSEFFELNSAERNLLRDTAGAIMSEDSQGFVHVSYFDTTDDLERNWAEILADETITGSDEDGCAACAGTLDGVIGPDGRCDACGHVAYDA